MAANYLDEEEEEDCYDQSSSNGGERHAGWGQGFKGLVRAITPSCRVKVALWSVAAALCVLVVGIVIAEGHFRRNWPESPRRPSALVSTWAKHAQSVFRWIGWHLACLLDIYEWVHGLILDLWALVIPTINLLVSPFWFFKGWYQYFGNTFTTLTLALAAPMSLPKPALCVFYGLVMPAVLGIFISWTGIPNLRAKNKAV